MNIHFYTGTPDLKERTDKREAILKAALELFAERASTDRVRCAERPASAPHPLPLLRDKEALATPSSRSRRRALLGPAQRLPVDAAAGQLFPSSAAPGRFAAEDPQSSPSWSSTTHRLLDEKSRRLEDEGLRLLQGSSSAPRRSRS